jgi:sterol desaturase/sphingolipid hydroxylase (fatty acid hydroxylase superfamily)
MNGTLKMIITISNYSHDIATAILAISAVTMYLLYRRYRESENLQTVRFFINAYTKITRLATVCLVWILLAGVPRVIFYKKLEWSIAAGQTQIVAIMIKHIFMFLLVGTGILYWRRVSKKVRQLKEKYLLGG